jgi:acetyltransferase-like isoleucine patch superfamily enzyme
MLKRILTKIFLKIIKTDYLVSEIDNRYIQRLYLSCCTASTTVLYKTTSVQNRLKDKTKIIIGEHTHIKGNLMTMGYGGEIKIGDNTFIGEYSNIWSGSSIKIGNNVLISHNVNVIDTNSHELNHLKRANDFISLIKEGYATKQGSIVCDDIVIEDYAWINFNAVIQKGVRVGKGAIIAPSSVVTEDVEAFTLVGGNPAKFIKYLEQ